MDTWVKRNGFITYKSIRYQLLLFRKENIFTVHWELPFTLSHLKIIMSQSNWVYQNSAFIFPKWYLFNLTTLLRLISTFSFFFILKFCFILPSFVKVPFLQAEVMCRWFLHPLRMNDLLEWILKFSILVSDQYLCETHLCWWYLSLNRIQAWPRYVF